MNDDPDGSSPNLPDSAPDIEIDVGVTARAWRARLPDLDGLIGRAVRAALAGARDTKPVVGPCAGPSAGPLEVSLVLADDARVRRLNRDYRGEDKATNVLSFPAEDEPGDGAVAAGPRLLGDVVLALETVEREAEAQGKSLADHTCHLVVHGVLHLLGYDHEAEAEAERMERLEVAILGGLGIADPYAGAAERG